MPEEKRFLYRMIRGGIGKEYVIKHYKGRRIFRTKFPDMSRIVATEKQRACRNKFKEAVAYSREFISDPKRKRAYQLKKRIRNNDVYNRVIGEYLLREKRAREAADLLAERLWRQAVEEVPADFMEKSEITQRVLRTDVQQVMWTEAQGVLWRDAQRVPWTDWRIIKATVNGFFTPKTTSPSLPPQLPDTGQ